MKILLTGASGLVGKALKPQLEALGHRVVELSTQNRPGAYHWKPEEGKIPQEALQGVEEVIHLAGSPIDARWTPQRKALIYKSRVLTTRALCEQLLSVSPKPRRIIFASGAHICPYLDQPEAPVTVVTQTHPSFLATVVKDWELASQLLEKARVPVVHLRLGVVMTPRGGMLKKMLPLARCRLTPILGSGKQIISWISLEDAIGVILWSLNQKGLKGPLNLVAPHPLSQLEWGKALAQHYAHRPYLRLPERLLKLIFGQMAEELIFKSLYIKPERLMKLGYSFRFSHFSDYVNFSLA